MAVPPGDGSPGGTGKGWRREQDRMCQMFQTWNSESWPAGHPVLPVKVSR
jgi:hypothetical protein